MDFYDIGMGNIGNTAFVKIATRELVSFFDGEDFEGVLLAIGL